MPLARIITRAIDESQELAAELRGRGFDVEIVPPSDSAKTRADVELRLEECTPEEALIRAGVLPETNDMAVFIAPGAITGRRPVLNMPSLVACARPAVAQPKWYELAPDPTIPTDDAMNLPLASLEEVACAAIADAEVDLGDGQLDTLTDADDEPLFARLAKELDARVETEPMMPGATGGAPLSPEARVEQPVASDARAEAPLATSKSHSLPPRSVRLKLPITPLFWRRAASVAALAAIVVVMGTWVHRNAPVPAGFGTLLEAREATPRPNATVSQPATTPAAVKPNVPAAAAQKPAPAESRSQASSSLLVPQAAAAVIPLTKSKTPNKAKAAPRAKRSGEQLIAEDTVRRAAPRSPKPKPAKPQPNDGIKRYSDLD